MLLHHSLLTVPSLAEPYRAPRPSTWGTASWWLTYSPLHLLWDGTEAVFVFFVLSGFVLAAPAAGGAPTRWCAYYPRRLIRLYVPVWAAVALGAAWIVVIPRSTAPGASWWTNAHSGIVDLRAIARDVVLLRHPGATSSVLWSLTWEVLFSLTLPAFLIFARWLRRPLDLVGGALCLLGVAWGAYHGSAPYTFLPMFGLGVLLAFRLVPRIRSQQGVPGEQGRWHAVVAGASLLLLNTYWYGRVLPGPTLTPLTVAVTRASEVIGACLALYSALTWRPLRTLLARRIPQWLGSRSFSLYLVHEPIVVSTAMVLRDGSRIVELALVALPASLAAAEVFYRLVERPSISFAREIGRRASRSPRP